MKTPLIIVLVIVAAMLGFLTIYSQQSGGVDQTSSAVNEGSAAAVAGGNVSAVPAATPETTPSAGGK